MAEEGRERRREMAFRGEGLETDVPQKKQTAATDSMEGISLPLRDDGRAGAMLTRCRPLLKHTG